MNHPNRRSDQVLKIVCIGGFDSSLGAGVGLDSRILKNLSANYSIITTALTTQDHKNLYKVEFTEGNSLWEQLENTFPKIPCIVKIGMIGSFENLKIIHKFLKDRNDFIILDPILSSSSKGELFEIEGLDFLKESFFPLVDLLTPNLDEAKILFEDFKDFKKFGVKNILIKGGHAKDQGEYIVDKFFGEEGEFNIRSRKIKRTLPTRGTGCALASSISYGLSIGLTLKDSLILAKINLSKNLRTARLDKDAYIIEPRGTFADDLSISDMPVINPRDEFFPKIDLEGINLYPIVDRAEFLNKIKGVKIAQLRIKDLKRICLEEEIKEGIRVSKELGIDLYINDYVELAKKYHAFGIHLGQEDLLNFNPKDLIKSGMRLGISTHSYFELAVALGYNPSYIAFGPIFHTNLKAMDFAPQGIENLKIIRKLTDLPLVAIGGITLEKVMEILKAKVDLISVVSDISKHQDPPLRVKAWNETLVGAVQ